MQETDKRIEALQIALLEERAKAIYYEIDSTEWAQLSDALTKSYYETAYVELKRELLDVFE